MKFLVIYLAGLLACLGASAQQAMFLQQGRIEYERKINVHARLDAMYLDADNTSWRDLQKKATPQFFVSYFDLLFNNNTTLYSPGRENADNARRWETPAETNVVYSLLGSGRSLAQKKVFEQTFLVDDSLRQIKWKITDETRKIAGFDCRRANAVIMDSIYVVAFYTDAIVTPGGPESFTGLPGMILGVALPHEHVTWFATKVLVEDVKETALPAPKKGKKVNNATLAETVGKALKDWGNYGKDYLKSIML